MAEASITCPKCLQGVPLPPGAWDTTVDAACPRCGVKLALAAFPRLIAGTAAARASATGLAAQDGEAVCRFYPELQAEAICAECGCLMSRKAAVEWGGRTLCMPCLHQMRETKGKDDFSSKRTLHDNVAIGLVVFLAPLTLVTGPIAVFYLLRHRNSPRGLVPRSSFRWWLALVISLAVTAGWIFLFVTWIAMLVRAMSS